MIPGMIIDIAALIPIRIPSSFRSWMLGIDPLQFGMILSVNLGLGLCTPLVGTCPFFGD